MLLDYVPRNTFLHRLHVTTKLIGFAGIVVLCFAIAHAAYNLVVLFVCVAAAASCRLPLRRLTDFLLPLVPIAILMLAVSAFSYGVEDFHSAAARVPLFKIGGFSVLTGSVLRGCNLVLRIMIMVLSSTILTFTTPIEAFLHILRRLHVPYEISFILATGIRFVPTLERKSRMVIDAQRARGASIESGIILKRIGAYAAIMVPLLVESIRMANDLALAMVNRGFGAVRHRTELEDSRMTPEDYLLSMIFAFAVIAGLIIWILDLARI